MAEEREVNGTLYLVEENEGWDTYEVSRAGDVVYLEFSRLSGDTLVLLFSPESAETLGLSLAQAGFTSEEIKSEQDQD